MKTLIFAVAVAFTWLLFPQPTVAQPAEDGDSARAAARFQQGVDLYREGSYEGALAEFRKAYQISPSYRVLYNIAQTQYALHDYVGAHRSLAQYTTEGLGDITPERRAQVDEMSARLAERIAHLRIATNVAGADIRVDDVSVGTTPLSVPIPVNVGTRKVSALKAGSPPAVRVLTVAGQENVKVDLQIEDPMVTPAAPASRAAHGAATAAGASLSTPLTVKAPGSGPPGRTGLIVSLSTTAALAVGTGWFAYLALDAQKDLEHQVNTYPNTRDNIEDARAKSKKYGYLTDAFGAATVVSGAVALYFALTHPGASPKPSSPKGGRSVGLAPTASGVVVHGTF